MKTPELKKAIEWIEGQEDPYIKNEHGQFIYYSEHRSHGINLPHILSDYATSQIEEATRHSSETFKDMTERCNQYHAQIEELTKEVERLNDKYQRLVNIVGDKEHQANQTAERFAETCMRLTKDLMAKEKENDRYREAFEWIRNRLSDYRSEGTKPSTAGIDIMLSKAESALHPLVKEGE